MFKKYIWIIINVLSVIFLGVIGELYPQTQEVISTGLKLYLFLICIFFTLYAFKFSPKNEYYTERMAKYTKVITILWLFLGISLIVLFLFKYLNNLPVIFLYIVFSPIVAILIHAFEIFDK